MWEAMRLWFLSVVCYCQVDVILSDGTFARAAVPSGASTGKRSLFVRESRGNDIWLFSFFNYFFNVSCFYWTFFFWWVLLLLNCLHDLRNIWICCIFCMRFVVKDCLCYVLLWCLKHNPKWYICWSLTNMHICVVCFIDVYWLQMQKFHLKTA